MERIARFRFGALFEWAVAVAAIFVLVAAGSFLSREYRSVTGVIPINVSAREAPVPLIAPPATIPPGAVSLPMLLLRGQPEIRIGDTISDVTARVGPGRDPSPSVERAPNGERVTRIYEINNLRFRLVFEPFDRNAEPRLAAIYR